MKRRSVVMLAVAGLFGTSVLVSGRAFVPAAPEYVEGEVLVQFRDNVTALRRASILAAQQITEIKRFETLNISQLRLRPGRDEHAALGALNGLAEVLDSGLNYISTSVDVPIVPNDPFFGDGSLWGMNAISAPAAWTTFGTGSSSVVVASIDSGVNYLHPDLAPNMWHNPGEIAGNGVDDDHNGYVDDIYGIDARNNDSDPMDDNGHGTHTSGTIAAVGNNATGVVGVSWNSRILACKFLDASGSGSDSDAIECFNYLVNLKNHGVNVRVTNNSWGRLRGGGVDGGPLKSAIDAAGNAGILNVFAAGNNGVNTDVTPADPASYSSASIVSVAASDSGDNRPGFSNWGAVTVDLAAPGVGILSTYGSSYGTAQGTSMAAPHVAGAAALLVSISPSITVANLKQALINGVDHLAQWAGNVVSGGRLNVYLSSGIASGNLPPTVSLTSPPDAAVFTAPATVPLSATAGDTDGWITSVEFFANGTSLGVDTTSPYDLTWMNVVAGTYTLTAVATDDDGATKTSASRTITVNAAVGGRTNVALASNGGTAVTSSFWSAGFTGSMAINGDRRGLNWGNGGGWQDGTPSGFPDWLEVQFAGPKTLDEIDVFTLQDAYTAPADPTLAMTFTQYGIQDYEVQYWTGAGWQAVPGGVVAGNNRVWRQFTFTAITTTKIRLWITGAPWVSRVTEVEAWSGGAAGPANTPPTVALTGPADGATFVAPATITVDANASDDGSVASVEFFVNGTSIGVDATSPYSSSWQATAAGTYVLTAKATDNLGATTTSAARTITVTAAAAGRTNVALSSNGGTAVASSIWTQGFAASTTINGERRGDNWGNGGGWQDGSPSGFPDWLEVQFAGAKTIDEIDVLTVQDAYTAPADPTLGMTFTLYGLQDFEVQYWTGAVWQPVPGGVVAGNNRVWRQFTFTAITTTKIRLWITGAPWLSRVTELEAWSGGGAAPVNTPPTVALTAPADGATFVAPATITVNANASDDGTVASVEFFANGTSIGVDTTSPYSGSWQATLAGSYTLTAKATDNLGATTISAARTITVTTGGTRTNVALASNGGTAAASSFWTLGFAPSMTINGDRRGLNWGNGGGWQDGTPGSFPDWLEVQFAGAKTIDEIDVFTLQDAYNAPADPTLAMTFTQYGLRSFEVQYWTGSAWQAVPGGVVAGNNLVWRQFTFAPLTTSKIRVWITAAAGSWSMVTEVEAWSPGSSPTDTPALDLTAPAGHDAFLEAARPAFYTEHDLDSVERRRTGQPGV